MSSPPVAPVNQTGSSSSAETSAHASQVVQHEASVDHSIDHANRTFEGQDREVGPMVSARSGIFDRAHDVYGGSFMSAAGSINIYHNSQPPNNATPIISQPTVIAAVASDSESSARSSEIYHRNLITKRRGSPLWIPEPDSASPTPYQQKGVSFGDVGLLPPSGSFDFFFNICYPSDHPINSGGVPEGFIPFRQSSLRIRRLQEYEAASYVASESIRISRKQYSDSRAATDLVFESSAAEGAILTMPHGAQSEDLMGTRHLREYVEDNIESWYKLIMGDVGCDIENGDILVVTGCDKTDSWGVATFVQSSESETVKLAFQPTPSSHSYSWEYSGSFDARTGPNSKAIQGLQSSTNATVVVSSEPLLNQCVFVCTMTCTLRDDIWQSLRRSVSRLDSDKDVHKGESCPAGDVGPGTFSLPTSGCSTENGNSWQSEGSGQQRQNLLSIETSVSVVSNVSQTMMNHPSKLLNNFLWTVSGHKYPLARVVITEDKDWMSVLRDGESTLPDIEELYKRITEPEVEDVNNPSAGFLTRSFVAAGHGFHPTFDHNNALSQDNGLQGVDFSSDHMPKTQNDLTLPDNQELYRQRQEGEVEMAENPGNGQRNQLYIFNISFPPESSEDENSEDEFSEDELLELADGEFSEHFSERDGRLFHSSSTSPYPLPVDTPEQERLTMNHDIFRLFFGSHSIGPVSELLGDSPYHFRQKMILDMCTGNGKWPIAMAQQFPKVHIRAFDIVPIATRYPPENVQFEIHDVNNIPFRWRDGTFDVVNARDIAMAVHDYGAVLQEAVRLLRPGGLFISYEWAPRSPINLNVPPSPNYIPAITHFHNSVNAAFHLTRNMQILSDQVRRYIVDVGAFTDITATEYLIPIGDWHTDATMKEVGLLSLEANKRYGDSVKPLLMEAGWTGAQVEGLLEDYKRELDNAIGLNSVLVTVYATKT